MWGYGVRQLGEAGGGEGGRREGNVGERVEVRTYHMIKPLPPSQLKLGRLNFFPGQLSHFLV